jgi:hypothetical protein
MTDSFNDGQSGYAAFMIDRIKRGSMEPAACNRACRFSKELRSEECRSFFRFQDIDSAPLSGKLQIFDAQLGVANLFILEHHRHHQPVIGHVFSIGVKDANRVRGYAIVGRPVSRHLDDGNTLEVLRVATDGSRNACSKLYGGVRKKAKQLNRAESKAYRKIITYTLSGAEPGASLRAAGFKIERITAGGSWDTPSRPRVDRHPTGEKIRWSTDL